MEQDHRTLEHLRRALAGAPLAGSDDGPGLDQLVEALEARLGGLIPLRWRDVRAAEVVLDEVAREFEGEDRSSRRPGRRSPKPGGSCKSTPPPWGTTDRCSNCLSRRRKTWTWPTSCWRRGCACLRDGIRPSVTRPLVWDGPALTGHGAPTLFSATRAAWRLTL